MNKLMKWWKNYTLVEINYRGMSGYGVRKGWVFLCYHDFRAIKELWLNENDAWFSCCITTKEKAERLIKDGGRKEVTVNIKEVK